MAVPVMPRLYRPSIPIEVKCRVALRQLGYINIDAIIEAHGYDHTEVAPDYRRTHGKLLESLLPLLASKLGCATDELRLDHDPALENRMKRTVTKIWRGKIKQIMVYSPDANDQRHLIYREKHDHHIKTNVRGERGQYPDNTIAKRERRRLKKIPTAKASGLQNQRSWIKRATDSRSKLRPAKRKWPSRPFQKRRKKR